MASIFDGPDWDGAGVIAQSYILCCQKLVGLSKEPRLDIREILVGQSSDHM
jgi:hypothetical protein